MVVQVRTESENAFGMVLRRLKAMEELRVTAIRSCFCAAARGDVDERRSGGPGSRRRPPGCQVSPFSNLLKKNKGYLMLDVTTM
jgi:hypothetical protein